MDGRPPRATGRRGAGLGSHARARVHPTAAPTDGHPRRSRCPSRFQKGGLRDAVERIRTIHPKATVSLWAEDEHRVGLLPVVRRVWAPRGQRPTAWVHRRYEWLYVYSFVRPTTGQSWWCLLPTVSTVAMNLALAAFARDEGIDALHRAVLVLDGAGWHTSTDLVLPAGLDLVVLPATSPELQPVEPTWLLLDAPVANRTVADMDALEATLVARCQTLGADRTSFRSQTCFHWWPSDLAPALLQ